MAEEKDLNEEVEVTEAEAADNEETTEKEDKKDKKKKADKKTDELKAKIAELEDARLRQMAEFQNFRNRTEKEKSQMFDNGAMRVIQSMLPVVDNFERGLQTIPEEEKDSPFANGMNLIYKQLMTELDKLGVKPMDAVGKEMDPRFHNAVMTVASEEFESGVVVEELQKGYMYNDNVVRVSMVSVAE